MEQTKRMGVPESHLGGHAFHTYRSACASKLPQHLDSSATDCLTRWAGHAYRLTSPGGDVEFVFQHNVCGRTIYAEGTVDAALFLAKKVAEGSEKRIFDMIDVLREGAMR